MESKDQLTNEKIRKKFASQFELVNYAIKLAENMIITGRSPLVKVDSQNCSSQVLAEILNGKDRFHEIADAEKDGKTEPKKFEDFSSHSPTIKEKKQREKKKPEISSRLNGWIIYD